MALTAETMRRLTVALASQTAAAEIITILNNLAAGTFTGNQAINGNLAITGSETISGTLLVTGSQTIGDGSNLVINTNTGTQIGTAANQKIGLWGATPVVQPSGTGELLGLNGNAATAANATNMNSNGNLGSTFYNFNDLVKDLKLSGAIAR
jgi:hypothetical protein